MDANLRDLRALAKLPTGILKLFAVSDRAKVLAERKRYIQLPAGQIQDIWYQQKIVKDACEKRNGAYAYQLPPGSGKTYPSAEISANFQKLGKTLYICPNVAALGDEKSGIIQKFKRMYSKRGVAAEIGAVNDSSKTNSVHFFTPGAFVGLRKLQRSLFEQILDEVSVLIVDEAHHFPKENDGRHKVFGEIDKIAQEYFLERHKKVVAFTATYGRLDGRPPLIPQPDFKLSVQDMVNEGRCPEIHGQQIFLPFHCPNARDSNQDYDLKLEGQEEADYWRLVAGCMLETYKRNPAPFAAFVRLQADANYLARVYNNSSKTLKGQIAIMTAHTPMPERLKIIEKINKGSLAGYVTCGVGEEAIDIPRIEVIHFIKRTKSSTKLMQAVGRSLRVHEEKARALFVDYQVMKESVIRACNGIFQFAEACGIDPEAIKNRPNGGAIVAVEGAASAIIPGAETFGEVEALIRKQIGMETSSYIKRKEIVFRYAATGAERPSDKCEGEFEGESLAKLGHLFYRVNNPNGKEYDKEFLDRLHKLPKLHPSWKQLLKAKMQDREAELLRMGAAKEPKPKWKGPQLMLAYSLQAWTTKADPKYKPEFDKKIREVAPHWFPKKDVPLTQEAPPEFRVEKAPTPPPPPPAPEGHWFNTGYWLNASRSFLGRNRDYVQPIILQALKDGAFPNDFKESDKDSVSNYFVSTYGDVNFHLLEVSINGRYATRKAPKHGRFNVPVVWRLGDLIDGLECYSQRDLYQAGRKYHLPFSFLVRLFYPECPFISSLLFGRKDTSGKQHGSMSPWEINLKAEEKNYLQNFSKLDKQTQKYQLLKFAYLDGEFIPAVRYESRYSHTEWEDTFNYIPKENCKGIYDLIRMLPEDLRDKPRKQRGGYSTTILESIAQDLYMKLADMEPGVIDRCGGYAAIDSLIQGILSMTGYSSKETRFSLMSTSLWEKYNELEQYMRKIGFLHQRQFLDALFTPIKDEEDFDDEVAE